MSLTPSKYYKLGIGDGMEALYVKNYHSAFPYHYHPTYNITLVYDGSFVTQLSSKLLVSPMGTILITNPQEIHANPFEKNSMVSFFTFYVGQDFMEYCNDGKAVVFNEKVIYDAGLFTALHNLATAISKSNIGQHHEHEFTKVLGQLASSHGDHDVEVADAQMKSLFDDLFKEETMKFSLGDAAKRFGIDKFKFIRLFKAQTGLTPNNYFILTRIEKSKTMLAEGRDLLSIAIDLGFYDTAHYCNHFKKFTGISPIAYSSNL